MLKFAIGCSRCLSESTVYMYMLHLVHVAQLSIPYVPFLAVNALSYLGFSKINGHGLWFDTLCLFYKNNVIYFFNETNLDVIVIINWRAQSHCNNCIINFILFILFFKKPSCLNSMIYFSSAELLQFGIGQNWLPIVVFFQLSQPTSLESLNDHLF
jgi:hypothetical protein